MHLASPLAKKHARIEIIPLIDIMFFLLASFMMVSLSQTHMKGIQVNLPAQVTPPPTQQKDYVSIRVAVGGVYYVDGHPMGEAEMGQYLFRLHQQNPGLKVSISGEMMALHGDVIHALDIVRNLQIDKIGYQIRAAPKMGP